MQSPTGYVALFKREQKPTARLPVMAWDPETHDALVVHRDRGRLIRATELRDFFGLDETEAPIVAVLPHPPGWTVEEHEGTFHGSRVRAWAIDADGLMFPVVERDDGWALADRDASWSIRTETGTAS